jgi:hypothetical protein
LTGITSLRNTYKGDPFVGCRDNHSVNSVALAVVKAMIASSSSSILKMAVVTISIVGGRTALVESAFRGRLKVVEFLPKHGADPRVKARIGRNAYFCSEPSRETAMIRGRSSHYQESREAETNRRIISIML